MNQPILLAFLWAQLSLGLLALPQAPETLMATPLSNEVALAWSPVPGALAFVVKRSATATGAQTVVASVSRETFADKSALNGSTYFYAVAALDAEGEGPATPRLRASPSAPVLDWLPAGAKMEKLAGAFQFTEGPVWTPEGRLIFSDIQANRLVAWTESAGAVTFRSTSGQANGNTLDLEGRLITCEHANRRISRTEKDGTITPLVTTYLGKRFNAPNDAVVKSDGTIWFTDPNYGLGQLQPGRYVFRFHPSDPTNTLAAVATDFDQPNGLAFSPDESKLYIADSGAPHHVRVFDVRADNTLANGRIFTVINPGGPDGMRVDKEGRLFSSAGDGVQIFSPEGTLLGRLRTPEAAANVAFGGPAGDQIFATARTSLYGVTRKPDLIVSEIRRLPATVLPGQEVTFLCVVRNQGTGRMEAGRSARVSLSVNAQTNLWVSSAFADLPPDASVLLTIRPARQSGWRPEPGSQPVYAVVDFEAQIAESNERNNQTNTTLVTATASPDTDQDGLSDTDELKAGTDPNSSGSVLKILSVEQAPEGTLRLLWSSRPGITYVISTKRTLDDLQWLDYPQPVASTGDTATWTRPPGSGASSGFLRVRVGP